MATVQTEDRLRRTPGAAAASRGSVLSGLRRMPILVQQILLVLLFLAFWQYASGRLIKELWVSSPLAVAQRLYDLFSTGEIWPDIRITLTEFVLGYVIGAVPGIVVGMLLGRSKYWSDLIQPFITAFNAIPKSALAPLFIIWFGIDLNSKIAMVSTFTFFLTFIGTFAGVRNIDERFINLACIMGASRSYIIRRIMLPSAAPEILLGLRTSVPYGMIGAVIGEFISASRGIGYYIYYRSQLFDPTGLFAGVIILVFLVMVVSHALEWIERRTMRWRPVVETHIAV